MLQANFRPPRCIHVWTRNDWTRTENGVEFLDWTKVRPTGRSVFMTSLIRHRCMIICAYNNFQYLLTVKIYEYFCIFWSKWFINRRAYVLKHNKIVIFNYLIVNIRSVNVVVGLLLNWSWYLHIYHISFSINCKNI